MDANAAASRGQSAPVDEKRSTPAVEAPLGAPSSNLQPQAHQGPLLQPHMVHPMQWGEVQRYGPHRGQTTLRASSGSMQVQHQPQHQPQHQQLQQNQQQHPRHHPGLQQGHYAGMAVQAGHYYGSTHPLTSMQQYQPQHQYQPSYTHWFGGFAGPPAHDPYNPAVPPPWAMAAQGYYAAAPQPAGAYLHHPQHVVAAGHPYSLAYPGQGQAWVPPPQSMAQQQQLLQSQGQGGARSATADPSTIPVLHATVVVAEQGGGSRERGGGPAPSGSGRAPGGSSGASGAEGSGEGASASAGGGRRARHGGGGSSGSARSHAKTLAPLPVAGEWRSSDGRGAELLLSPPGSFRWVHPPAELSVAGGVEPSGGLQELSGRWTVLAGHVDAGTLLLELANGKSLHVRFQRLPAVEGAMLFEGAQYQRVAPTSAASSSGSGAGVRGGAGRLAQQPSQALPQRTSGRQQQAGREALPVQSDAADVVARLVAAAAHGQPAGQGGPATAAGKLEAGEEADALPAQSSSLPTSHLPEPEAARPHLEQDAQHAAQQLAGLSLH